jgi:hypothetical protein
MRLLALLCLFAAPAAADTGPCVDDMAWTGEPGFAAFGPCDAPDTGPLRLSCRDGTVSLAFHSPYPIAVGQDGTAELYVDGRSWRVEGAGADVDGARILSGVALDSGIVAALRAGKAGRISGPAEVTLFHLTGSGTALADLCEG